MKRRLNTDGTGGARNCADAALNLDAVTENMAALVLGLTAIRTQTQNLIKSLATANLSPFTRLRFAFTVVKRDRGLRELLEDNPHWAKDREALGSLLRESKAELLGMWKDSLPSKGHTKSKIRNPAAGE
jgi:hypothetical protein